VLLEQDWDEPLQNQANDHGRPQVGMVDLIAELHHADTTVIHRQPIQIGWVPTSPAVAAQVPAITLIREAAAINCGFVSYEQCMAASRWCNHNPMYQPPAGEPRSRRR
jgi:hypothetical protein